MFSRQADAGILDIMPSAITLFFRSTRDHRGNCGPILLAVRSYRIRQLDNFVFCPLTRTFIRSVDAGIQDIAPSVTTQYFRSTRDQRGNYGQTLATVRLYCILQLAVFVCCPWTHPSIRLVDSGMQESTPSIPTLDFRSTRDDPTMVS
jgi:hypothetical protein